jgi:cytochrome oxidase assembly protein ShyY1
MTQGGSWRGMVVPALMTLIIVAGLLALGCWQLQRRDEKHALMTALSERLAAAPSALPQRSQWSGLTREHDEFRRVTFAAAFKPVPDAKVYSSGSALRADLAGVGVFVFQPVVTPDDQMIVVDRGFVPDGAVAAGAPATQIQLTGYLRFPEPSGWVTPAADLAKRLWFVRDHLAMARALHWGSDAAPFYLALEAPAPPSGVPKPGPLEVRLKDDHLQYAITWFGLALAVAIAFCVWLRGARRP